jgi:predicted ferric reductase
MTTTLPDVAEDPTRDRPQVPATSSAGLSGRQVALVGVVVAISMLAGHELAVALVPAIEANKLSWVLGRGLGIASFLSLSALVGFGTWVRHPIRARVKWPAPPTTLAVHASLGAATLTLVAAHLTALAIDPWAKIGWVGALVPWASSYRPTPVALGTVALWGIVVVGGTARMAGRLGRKRWLRVHRLAWVVWLSALLHGLTSGSDTMALRYVYASAAALIVLLWATSRLVPAPRRSRPAATPSGGAG